MRTRTNALPPAAEMERAYLRKDSAYDGLFVLGVRTTGIFCRPTCGARKPLPKNVEYFSTPREALASGYRPCKRCHPLEAEGLPSWAHALIEEIDGDPAARIREGDLRRRGLDPSTVRRTFLRHYGMTFHAYARSRRLGEALHRIREGETLDDVVFDSGYESHSGFREAFTRAFGAPPGRARGQECVTLSWVRTPIGPMIAGAVDERVCLLEFTERRMLATQFQTVQRLFRRPLLTGKIAVLERLEDELQAYFDGRLRRFTTPLVYPGTPFQQRVWAALLEIPYGETRSYEDLAVVLGIPGAQRAVGRANGMNRIGVVIPCHRVVNKDGRLGGYGGGLRRKEWLLRLEKAKVGPRETAEAGRLM